MELATMVGFTMVAPFFNTSWPLEGLAVTDASSTTQ